MNKGEFIEFIANQNSISKADAEKSINLFTEGVIGAIESGHDVSLIGFGNFSSNKVDARTGINPKTKEPLKIEARNQVRFKVGIKLKEAANSKSSEYSKTGKDKAAQKNATGKKDNKDINNKK